jgi:DNA repair exonuclease SbcCD ATPase subunit
VTYTETLAAKRRELDAQVGQARLVAEEGRRVAAEVDKLTADIQMYEELTALFQTISEERQNDLQNKIQTLVTHGLQTIFGEDISFRILTSSHGKLAASDLVVVSTVGGEEVETPVLEARGGGMANVVGFLLRLVILMLTAGARRTIVLDETFAQLSAEYEPLLADFLRELVDKTDIQIIMVTHSTAFDDAADVSYRFSLHSGETRVTPLK